MPVSAAVNRCGVIEVVRHIAWLFYGRARLYAEQDRLLAARTRFFAAAAVTNRALGDVALLQRALGISYDSLALLGELGGALESFNQQAALELAAAVHAPDVDRRMVHREQHHLELAIRLAETRSPDRCQLLRDELNRLLNRAPAAHRVLRLFRPSLAAYGDTLEAARTDLGCALDFAQPAHRAAIGIALIRELEGGSQLPGAGRWQPDEARARRAREAG